AAGDGGLTKSGSGITTISYVNTYNGPTVINAGTLKIGAAPPTPVLKSTNVYIATGAVFDSSLISGFIVQSGRKLWGNGIVIGNLVITNSAILEPGTNAIGKLTFNDSLTLAA